MSKRPAVAARLSAISNEPLVNAFQRHLPYIAAVSYALGLVYVCLVPFEFTAPQPPKPGTTVFWGLRMTPVSYRDIVANITVYIPLGAILCMIGNRRGHKPMVAAAVSGLMGGILSLGIETAQRFTTLRFAAWSDVTANSLGAAMGAFLAAIFLPLLRRMLARALEQARKSWWLTAAKAAVCIVLVVQLRPFDVVVDLRAAAKKAYQSASLEPLARWNTISAQYFAALAHDRDDLADDVRRAGFEYALDRVADAAVYATLAAFFVLGRRRQRRGVMDACREAGMIVLVLSATVTFLRIFVATYGFDAAHLYCALASWPLGCAAGLWADRASRLHAKGLCGCSRPTLGRWASARVLMWALIVFVMLYELVPFDFKPPDARALDRFNLVPFAAHFASRTSVAINDITGDFLRYAIIGACLGILCDARTPRSWRVRLTLCTVAATCAATAAELAHAFMASRLSDVTTVLIAAPAALTGGVAVRWIHDLRRSIMVWTSDDLLTGQLIEGETYQPIAESEMKRKRPSGRGVKGSREIQNPSAPGSAGG